MEKAIEVKGLQKSYKQLNVLKDVDFEVEKGSIFALLGSNEACVYRQQFKTFVNQ